MLVFCVSEALNRHQMVYFMSAPVMWGWWAKTSNRQHRLPSKIAFKVVFLSQPRPRRPRSRRPTGVFLSKNGFTQLVVLYLSLHSRPTQADQGFDFRERRWIGTFSEFYAYKRRQTFKLPASPDFLKIAYFFVISSLFKLEYNFLGGPRINLKLRPENLTLQPTSNNNK